MRSLLALTVLLTAAAAQAGSGDSHGHKMAKVDTDGDGVITREEASSHAWLADRFDDVDANKDGRLEKSELAAQREAHHGEMKTRGEERWKAADTDGDGDLSRAEATASSSRLADHFDEMDANGDGTLTREEMAAAKRQRHERMRVHAAERFKGADANSDGGIDLAEAQTGLPWLAEKFSTADTDNDGKVTPEELKSLHHR